MKFATSRLSSSHIIGVAILGSKLLNRIIHNKINYSRTICVCMRETEREREEPDGGVPLILCGNEFAFSSIRRFIGIY